MTIKVAEKADLLEVARYFLRPGEPVKGKYAEVKKIAAQPGAEESYQVEFYSDDDGKKETGYVVDTVIISYDANGQFTKDIRTWKRSSNVRRPLDVVASEANQAHSKAFQTGKDASGKSVSFLFGDFAKMVRNRLLPPHATNVVVSSEGKTLESGKPLDKTYVGKPLTVEVSFARKRNIGIRITDQDGQEIEQGVLFTARDYVKIKVDEKTGTPSRMDDESPIPTFVRVAFTPPKEGIYRVGYFDKQTGQTEPFDFVTIQVGELEPKLTKYPVADISGKTGEVIDLGPVMIDRDGEVAFSVKNKLVAELREDLTDLLLIDGEPPLKEAGKLSLKAGTAYPLSFTPPAGFSGEYTLTITAGKTSSTTKITVALSDKDRFTKIEAALAAAQEEARKARAEAAAAAGDATKATTALEKEKVARELEKRRFEEKLARLNAAEIKQIQIDTFKGEIAKLGRVNSSSPNYTNGSVEFKLGFVDAPEPRRPGQPNNAVFTPEMEEYFRNIGRQTHRHNLTGAVPAIKIEGYTYASRGGEKYDARYTEAMAKRAEVLIQEGYNETPIAFGEPATAQLKTATADQVGGIDSSGTHAIGLREDVAKATAKIRKEKTNKYITVTIKFPDLATSAPAAPAAAPAAEAPAAPVKEAAPAPAAPAEAPKKPSAADLLGGEIE